MIQNSTPIDPWRVNVQHERIEVTSNSPRPDPEWRYTDARGHEHYYDPLDTTDRGGYPTLVWLWGDEMDAGWHKCDRCSERIAPGTIGPSMFPEYINGPTSVTLTYDDGRERREYAILTAEDAAGLTNPETRQATIDRIAATQTPATWEERPSMDFAVHAQSAHVVPKPESIKERLDRIERILNRIADVDDTSNQFWTDANGDHQRPKGMFAIIREEMNRD